MSGRMSEYIVEADGEYGVYRDGLFVLEDEYMAVPAEPLIRCRDCRYYEPNIYSHFTCELLMYQATPNDFCAWGERKRAKR